MNVKSTKVDYRKTLRVFPRFQSWDRSYYFKVETVFKLWYAVKNALLSYIVVPFLATTISAYSVSLISLSSMIQNQYKVNVQYSTCVNLIYIHIHVCVMCIYFINVFICTHMYTLWADAGGEMRCAPCRVFKGECPPLRF